jgi:methyl-accepting chemotaxis protein
MKIKTKLAASFAVILVLLVGIAGFGIYNLNQLNDAIQGLLSGALKSKEMAMQLNIDQAEQIRAQRNALLMTSLPEAAEYYKQAEARNDSIDEIATAFKSAARSEAGKAQAELISKMAAELRELTNRIRDVHLSGDRERAADLGYGAAQTRA